MAWSFARQIHLTFGRRSRRLHQYPACGGRGSGRRNHSRGGFLSHAKLRFVHLDPPGLIRSWKIREFGEHLSSGGFHHGSLNDDAGFPKRHQQHSRQRHDGRLFKTARRDQPVERLSSNEIKIAPRSLRMALGVSGRSAITCMAVSRVGDRNLTLPERRSLSTSPWNLERAPKCSVIVR